MATDTDDFMKRFNLDTITGLNHIMLFMPCQETVYCERDRILNVMSWE